MRDFVVACLSPPAVPDPSIAIAASRAGGLGFLDLGLHPDSHKAEAAIDLLCRLAREAVGLRLDGSQPESVRLVTRDLPDRVRTVILSPGEPLALRESVDHLRSSGLRIVLEATSIEEALLGEELRVDGLIAKGHEAAGRVQEETTFILLQRLLNRISLPVWAQGGIGLHTAAAAMVAGASGVVLDGQLLLTRESPLPRSAREAIGRMDGSETACVGRELGESWRLYDRPGLRATEELRAVARTLGSSPRPRSEVLRIWHETIRKRAGWRDRGRDAWILGQDAAFAAPLARRYQTVGGVIEAVRQSIDSHVEVARSLRPLDEASPLARSHGTRYPVVQGPMTRVSDNAAFARAVAEGGGLPFLALALMRAPQVRALLEETRTLLGDLPWGVGILGFVPLELRQEQMEAIRACPPPFALIAGGRPDQALSLEQDGIRTYLHVPSPALLKLFLDSGSRRFVFEGRECGGHVGPRSSFVLWNSMVDTILESLPAGQIADVHVLFAAGIHDAHSASMVAALAAPLAERGARVGVLLGTAYLFTHEAVQSGAIVEGFQQVALRCEKTVLLETGPGHATRCADSPYTGSFEQEKRRLLESGEPADAIRIALEELNLGRLRVATKGADRNPHYRQDPKVPKLRELDAAEQLTNGMFMIGQVAALRTSTCSIAELHREITVGGSERLARLERPSLARVLPGRDERPSDVAIVGMSCLLPRAPNLEAYWENILNRVDAITEVPRERWDWRAYFDADPGARDKMYSKWGGFLEDTPFDPMRYGMPPNSLRSIEPIQLLTLDVARAALQDAGYLVRPFPRERSSVILGAGGGVSDLGSLYAFRSLLPTFIADPPESLVARLPEWTEDSFPGILLNVAAGRVANRFDLGGVNCTIDAACASSLAAIYLAVKELETHTSDMVLAGGVDTAQNPFMFLCFSKTHAHSASGRCRTFDESADGIAISEGLAVVVLKRLADAERDGDRIYAVIKAVAGSSDGRDKGLTAPRPEGQMLALERAYAKGRISPSTIGLIEAHGTGTVAGDQAEVTTLKRVFEAGGASRQSCAIGSVKSMIGHTKCAAGVASLMKVALALHHKVLPPTLHVEKPNSRARFHDSPLYVNSELRPWLRRTDDQPRRAGVSSFGFGGTNFHAVLEEYTEEIPVPAPAVTGRRPYELYLWRGGTKEDILAEAGRLEAALSRGATPEPADLAYSLWRRASARGDGGLTLAIVASSIEDLGARLRTVLDRLRSGATAVADPGGAWFSATPVGRDGRVAFLFPGQGSQYPNMLRDLAVHFAEVRHEFERADRELVDRYPAPLSTLIFPTPAFTPEEKDARKKNLTATNVAQPALGAAGLAAYRLLDSLGVRPEIVAGHSYGEYVALCVAGVFDERSLALLSEARGRCILETAQQDLGTMAAVSESPQRVAEVLGSSSGVWIANLNAPRQTVLSGTRDGIESAVTLLETHGIQTRSIPVACAFHSPLVAPARDRLAEAFRRFDFKPPRVQVFSNSSAAAYPDDPQALVAILADHLIKPVRFADEVEAMYEAGARLFVEAGPRSVLTGLVQQTLGERPYLAVAMDGPGRSGLRQLLLALAQMAAHGAAVDLDRLFTSRPVRELALDSLEEQTRKAPLPVTAWLVNGGRARPVGEASRSTAPAILEPPVDSGPPAPRPGQPPLHAVPPAPDAPALPSALRSPAAEAPIANVSPGGDGELQVLLQFQQLMTRFLATQQEVMKAYFAGTDAATLAPRDELARSDAEHHPVADLSPGPVEAEGVSGIAASAAATRPAAPEPTAAAPQSAAGNTGSGGSSASAAPASRETMTRRLLEVAAERTGYPPDMIGLDLDIEADLGIDSIKRVEILGAFQRACPPAPERLQATMEQLTRAKTLRGILDIAVAAGAASGPSASAAATRPAAPEPTAAAPQSAAGNTGSGGSSASAAPASRETMTRRLLEVTAERTGYPPDMIGLDLDIEADLGIDSIKRVEILGAFQRACPPAPERLQATMEQLTRAKTLRGILDIAVAASAVSGPDDSAAATRPAAPEPMAAAPQSAAEISASGAGPTVPRFVIRPADAPLDGEPGFTADDRVYAITDDGRGVAAALADAIRGHGGRVAVLRMPTDVAETGDESYATDLTDEASVVRVIDLIQQRQGAIGGLIHLLPLGTDGPGGGNALVNWKERLDRGTGSLFCLAKALPGLRDARSGRAGQLIAATSMGGAFALDAAAASFFPGQGAIAGLMKTLAVEWPEVRCKVIDFDATGSPVDTAALLLREIAAADPAVEVGYRGSRRFVMLPVEKALEQRPATRVTPGPDWVVLVTGGARGITAQAACELAIRYRPTLLLSGRSPLPPPEEPAATSGLTSPSELKAALLNEMRRSGKDLLTPAAVEAAYRRLVQERDMRTSLAAMRQAGSKVQYFQVDVRDDRAMGDLVEEIYRTYGRLDGVIHGAGIIEDKLFEDKTAESFKRVFETKVDGALALIRRVRPEQLRFFVLFSSVAGRFGNRGQSDYAAANEVLNKLAILVDSDWPGRVVSVNWGPWMKAGMASASVQQRFLERGVQLVPPEQGRRALVDEIERGPKGDVEVILGDGPWRRAGRTARPVTAAPAAAPTGLPLLTGLSLSPGEGGSVELDRVLDPAHDLYLVDHQLDGRPVFPAAVAMELIAEVVRRGWPEQEVLAIESFRVLNGIVLENGPKPIRVRARAEAQPDHERQELAVDVSIDAPETRRTYYRASVRLGDRLPPAPRCVLPPLREARPFPLTLDHAYERWLFQGPLFRGIQEIEAIGTEGMTALLLPSTPARLVRAAGADPWIIDPVVLDSAFQLAILYSRVLSDMTPLPAHFRTFRRFAPLNGAPIRCELRARASNGGHVLETQTAFLGPDDSLLFLLEDMELSCSRELNRLAVRAGRGGSE